MYTSCGKFWAVVPTLPPWGGASVASLAVGDQLANLIHLLVFTVVRGTMFYSQSPPITVHSIGSCIEGFWKQLCHLACSVWWIFWKNMYLILDQRIFSGCCSVDLGKAATNMAEWQELEKERLQVKSENCLQCRLGKYSRMGVTEKFR